MSKRLGEQGKTIVRVLIGVDGPAQERRASSNRAAIDRLDEAARQAVMSWRCVPGKRNGVVEADGLQRADQLGSQLVFLEQFRMDSQFGLMNVWNQGDFVTKAVAVLLIGMSLASWIVILDQGARRRPVQAPRQALAGLLAQRRLRHRAEQARQGRQQPLPRAGARRP